MSKIVINKHKSFVQYQPAIDLTISSKKDTEIKERIKQQTKIENKE